MIINANSESEGPILWLISIFGGAPRKLRAHSQGARISPEGSSIALVSGHGHEIWVAGAEGGNAIRILNSESDEFQSLAWSPSGQRLAYLKSFEKAGLSNNFVSTIETLSVHGGSPSVVVSDLGLLSWGGLVWLRDGRLVYSLSEGSRNRPDENLWEIMTDLGTGVPSGKPAKITHWFGASPYGPSVSRDGSRLVVAKGHGWGDIYVGELKENGTRLDSPKRLTSSDSANFPFTWARDSGTILFSSDRMGRFQIFKQRLDADIAELLAKGPDGQMGGALSPDAAWIFYFSQEHGGESPPTSQRLMRIPGSGGLPEQVLGSACGPND